MKTHKVLEFAWENEGEGGDSPHVLSVFPRREQASDQPYRLDHHHDRHEREVDRLRGVEARGAVGEDRDVPAIVDGLVEVRSVEQPVVAAGDALRDGQLGDVEVFHPLARVARNFRHVRREVELLYPLGESEDGEGSTGRL